MNKMLSALAVGTVCLVPVLANAHIGMTTPLIADSTQEVVFNVGHGCSGKDTYSVKIEIPEGVSGVRALGNSDFATVAVEAGATAGSVKSVTWTKDASKVVAGDPNFYKLVLRFKAPKAPFTTLMFPATQVCREPGGADLPPVHWVVAEGAMGEPAPVARVLPARKTGWNKYTVPVDIADVSKFFDDAQIVWKGNAAYSANAATADQIKSTAGVETLTALAANDEIWVKY